MAPSEYLSQQSVSTSTSALHSAPRPGSGAPRDVFVQLDAGGRAGVRSAWSVPHTCPTCASQCFSSDCTPRRRDTASRPVKNSKNRKTQTFDRFCFHFYRRGKYLTVNVFSEKKSL